MLYSELNDKPTQEERSAGRDIPLTGLKQMKAAKWNLTRRFQMQQ